MKVTQAHVDRADDIYTAERPVSYYNQVTLPAMQRQRLRAVLEDYEANRQLFDTIHPDAPPNDDTAPTLAWPDVLAPPVYAAERTVEPPQDDTARLERAWKAYWDCTCNLRPGTDRPIQAAIEAFIGRPLVLK